MENSKWRIYLFIVAISLVLWAITLPVYAYESDHKAMIYPVVRVSSGSGGGSGTVIFSGINSNGETYSTYILTNYHVIASSISIKEEWDTDLQKNVKKEKRSIVYVEIFKYRNLSTPVGTLRIEAVIAVYNKSEDMAILKLRSEDKTAHVARLFPREDTDKLYVFRATVAVGCSLLFPPIPTLGMITRKNFMIDSMPYHMSSSQIIYGNSGGAMFTDTGLLIGIPSMLPVTGWGRTPITHMGLFIPIERIYKWMGKEHYDFIFDSTKTEKGSLALRKKEIEAKKKNRRN